MALILLRYIFDNRDRADGEKLDIHKYPENLTLVFTCTLDKWHIHHATLDKEKSGHFYSLSQTSLTEMR